jgi:hypothetical protein
MSEFGGVTREAEEADGSGRRGISCNVESLLMNAVIPPGKPSSVLYG